MEIVSSSHEYIRKSSNDIEFVVNVPADGEEKVCFEYRIDKRIEITWKNSIMRTPLSGVSY